MQISILLPRQFSLQIRCHLFLHFLHFLPSLIRNSSFEKKFFSPSLLFVHRKEFHALILLACSTRRRLFLFYSPLFLPPVPSLFLFRTQPCYDQQQEQLMRQLLFVLAISNYRHQKMNKYSILLLLPLFFLGKEEDRKIPKCGSFLRERERERERESETASICMAVIWVRDDGIRCNEMSEGRKDEEPAHAADSCWRRERKKEESWCC